MGEAKKRSDAEIIAGREAVERMAAVAVTGKDIMIGAAVMAVLGDFAVKTGPGITQDGEQQLRNYISYMRRALSAEKAMPVWQRIRCLTEAMAKNHDVLVAIGGEETEDGIAYDPQSDVFARVAATMPAVPSEGERSSITSSLWCPHDELISLARHGGH